MAEILLENVSKIYGKKVQFEAVKKFNLCIRDKEFLVLLGPSGCGKTSILRMIAGLEDVTQGTIYFDGVPVNNYPPGKRNIAMAFENYALYPTLTVRENIAFPLRTGKMKAELINEKIAWAAKNLQITDILRKKPSELSGGQQQRVSLARAFVRDVRVFLIDEPLSHLDMKQKQYMRAKIKRVNFDLKTTMIYVTHDQKEAMALADRIAVIHDGKLQQVGTPIEIYNDPQNAFVAGFVGEPAMNFIDCRVKAENDCFRLLDSDGGRTIACLPFRGGIAGLPSLVKIGIRPKKIRYSRIRNSSNQIQAEVFVYESAGEKGILTVKLNHRLLLILTKPEQKFAKRERLWISFHAADLYFFSPDTGKRLRTIQFKNAKDQQ